MTPQLWAHWLLIPALAIITTLDASGTFLRIDRAIRAAGAGPTPAPGALPAPGASPGSGALPVPGGDLGGTRPVRAFFAVAGTCFLALGVLGIVLPILPTTPFLLLAVASYARASVRLHAWLLSNRRFGPVIRSWQESRSLPPGARPRAIAVIAISFGVSIILVGDPLLRAGLAGGGLVLMAFVARLPERP
jgi:hypothetical protein